jgi:hypothetical protein
MTRVFLTVVVPLLLPTVIYLLWLVSFGRGRSSGGAMAWQGLPWVWLGLAGFVLAAAALFVLVGRSGPQTGTYVPPHFEDGRVVPGHMEPATPAH